MQKIDNSLEFNYFENIVEASAAGIIVVDAQGIIKKSNPVFNALVGYTQNQPTGKSFIEFVHKNKKVQKLTEAVKLHYFERSSKFPIEMHLRDKQGNVIPIRLRSSLLKDTNGEIIEAIGIIDALREDTGKNRLEQQIWETQETLQNLLANTGDAAILVDFYGAITNVNEALLIMLGYQIDEMIGKHLIELSPYEGTFTATTGEPISITPEYVNYQVEKANELFEKGRVTNYELYLIHKNGILVPVEATISLLKDQCGEHRGSIAICRDISERKKAEAEIKSTKDFLENIFKTSADGILVTDSLGYITKANEAAAKILGYSIDELIGKHPMEFSSPDNFKEQSHAVVDELMEKGIVSEVENIWIRKDTSSIIVELNAALLRDKDGALTGAVTCVRDISERKRTELKIQKEINFNKTFIESSPAFIVAIAPDGKTLLMNKAMRQSLGYNNDEVVGVDYLSHFVPAAERETLSSVFKQIIKAKEATVNENHIVTKNGEELLVEWHALPILNERQELEYFFGRGIDITERRRAENEIKKSKEFLEVIFKTSPDIIMLNDAEGNITLVNPAIEKILGYSPEELIGKHSTTLAPDEDLYKKYARKMIYTLFEQGFIINHEFYWRKKDGGVCPFECSSVLLKDDEGNVLGAVSFARDISERKATDENIRKAKEELEKFIDNSIDPIVMGDNIGHVVKPNKAFLDMIGFAEDEIIGMMVDKMSVTEPGTYESTTGDMVTITEDYFWESSAKIGELFETGKIISWESYYKHKSGKIIPTIQNISLVYDNAEKITSSFSIVRDLTEQKMVEKELRVSEEKFRALAESSIDAIVTSDSENIITFCNKSAEKMFGYSREELIGQPAGMLLPERFRERNKARIQQVLKQGITQLTGKFAESCCLKKNNQEFPIESSVTIYKIDDKVCFTSTIRDITERKKMEEQIRQSEKMEAIGTLAGGVAHDLNNILSAMVSYPELMLMNLPKNSPMRKPIMAIQSAGEKAAAIVNDMLTLARRGVNVSDVLNLNTVVTEYLDSPQGEKLKHFHPRADFEVNLVPDLLNTIGSPVHFTKTVMNLISNAAEAMPEGGKVTISTENQYLDKPIKGYADIKEGEYIVLTVKDTGTGIPKEDLTQIFEPFFTKKIMGRSGTGLGLAIVWGAVQDHNGYIEVDSEPGNGTIFKLYFPATRNEIEVKKESMPIETYSGNGEYILVVDDIAAQRDIASTILQKLNYHVETVAGGEEAVEYLKSKSADLVILDMIMDPGIDGLETYRRILDIQPQQKAIIASGFSATERVKEAQRLGVGTYIKKPYMMSEIGMAVKNELAN